jgi:hypothetical protein
MYILPRRKIDFEMLAGVKWERDSTWMVTVLPYAPTGVFFCVLVKLF